MEITSQNKMIKAHLESGRTITSMEALNLYGCFRLASRINDLRKSGMIISTEMAHYDGKRYAVYKLERGLKNESTIEH